MHTKCFHKLESATKLKKLKNALKLIFVQSQWKLDWPDWHENPSYCWIWFMRLICRYQEICWTWFYTLTNTLNMWMKRYDFYKYTWLINKYISKKKLEARLKKVDTDNIRILNGWQIYFDFFTNIFQNVDKYISKKKLEARLKKVDTDDRYIWKCAPSQQLDICPDSPAHMSNIMFQKLSKFAHMSNIMFQKLSKFDLCLAKHMYTE